MTITFSDYGFEANIGHGAEKFIWADVTQINVYKRDLITVDQLVIEVVFGDKIFRITDDDEPFFREFTDKIENNFEGISDSWWDDLVKPAFATNFRILYRKP